jgi:hypothetical protein
MLAGFHPSAHRIHENMSKRAVCSLRTRGNGPGPRQTRNPWGVTRVCSVLVLKMRVGIVGTCNTDWFIVTQYMA